MDYKEAREMYFENVVEFEYLIRQYTRIIGRPYKSNLGMQIKKMNLPKPSRIKKPYKDFLEVIKTFHFRKGYLKRFKNIRNNLAHKRGAKKINQKDIAFLENLTSDIKDMNRLITKLSNIKNKYEIEKEA